MIYKVWIQIEKIDEKKDHYLNIGEPYEAGKFDTEAEAVKFVENELMTTQIPDSAADLLEACKVLTSYTMDLLYRLDDQVNLSDIEEIQQARDAIAKYRSAQSPNVKLREVCQMGLKFLDTLPETELTTELENREGFRRMLSDGLSQNTLTVDDSCPKCGAGYDERELMGRNFIGIEAVHMHYVCNKCGSKMIEEFTLADVFIDEPPVS